MRPIDAEPIIKDLTAMKTVYTAIALDGMIKALKDAPTVDAVHVVRCKDCEYRHTIDCALDYAMFETTDITYCSYGKRKEGNKNAAN